MKRLPLSEQIAHPLHGERWLSNLFIFIYFLVCPALGATGAKLQALHVDPGMAPGNTDLHEDAAVSFLSTWPLGRRLAWASWINGVY